MNLRIQLNVVKLGEISCYVCDKIWGQIIKSNLKLVYSEFECQDSNF